MRILLVENDADTRTTMRMLLEAHGHQVTEVGDGESALGRLEGQPGQVYDGLVLDLIMPGLSGVDVIQGAIRLPQVVVISSGMSDLPDDVVRECPRAKLWVKGSKLSLLLEMLEGKT